MQSGEVSSAPKVKWKALNGDASIWGIAMILGLLSILVVYSASSSLAYKYMGGNTEYYLLKHSLLVLCGLFTTWIVHNIDFRFFYSIAKIGLLILIPLLIITWKYGVKLNDASRWISIPIIGYSFQPSESAQLCLVIHLCAYYAKHQSVIHKLDGSLIKMGFLVLVVSGLIGLANASAAIMLIVICFTIMFIGRTPIKYLIAMLGCLFVFGSAFLFVGQRQKTIVSRLEKFVTGQTSFQAEQSYIAIATGGISGKGPGNSMQRNILPHPYSDFVFAILIEEYGLIGGIAVLLVYLVLLYRTIRLLSVMTSIYRALMSVGIALSIVIQAFINIAVSIGLGPVTGVTLPFISMGGSSFLVTGAALGVILSCTRGKIEQNLD